MQFEMRRLSGQTIAFSSSSSRHRTGSSRRPNHTSRHNRRHREFGHLFSGRYKALLVDGSGDGYLKTVCDYVHLNPVRARLLSRRQPLSDFFWSSYPLYLGAPGKRPSWLRTDRLLGE